MLTKYRIDGTKAYVLGARITVFSGNPTFSSGRVGNTNLPNMVSPNPKTSCNEPINQYQGPNIVHGFLEMVLNNVMRNKRSQIIANTNKPINSPKETYLTPL